MHIAAGLSLSSRLSRRLVHTADLTHLSIPGGVHK